MDLNQMARSKPFMALLLVVAIIAIAVLAVSWDGTDGGDGDGNGPGTEPPREPPYVLEDQGFNHPVQDAFQGSNEPHIAVNPLNPMNMVAGSNDYSSPDSDAWTGYYWTFDGGKRWERNLIPGYPSGPVSALTGFEASGDPVVAAGPDGEFYFAGIAFKRTLPSLGRASSIFVAKSTDGGRTFGQVSMVAQSATQATFHDKEWIAVDKSDGPGRGNVYCVWAMFQATGSSQMVFSRSTDGGRTWSRPPRVLSDILNLEFQNQGAQIVVDNDGVIHVTWIDFEGGQHRYVRSTDQGASFSDPVDIGSVTPIEYQLPNGGYRTPTLPAFAVDNTGGSYDGSLYLTWNDMRAGDSDVMMIYSRDGSEWSDAIRVNDDADDTGADQFFPSICVAGNGTVAISFYDRRDDPDNTLLMVYHAESVDGGETFLPNIPISDVQFDGNAAGGRRKGGVFSGTPFMGDYTGSAAAGDFLISIWCDTRNGTPETPNSDIYVVRIRYAEVVSAPPDG